MIDTEKIKLCKEILNKYSAGCFVQKNDFDFLISIFKNHTEWNTKMGNGVKNISVQKTKYGNNCFYIHRLDGTSTDISYLHSIKSRTDIEKIKKACRTSVQPIISEYKKNNVIFGITKCAVTGEILTSENTHIDHYDLTFSEVFDLWIKNYDLIFLSTIINSTIDHNVDTFFTDKDVIEDFVKFHNQHTHLRAVTKKANLSILKTKTIKTLKIKTAQLVPDTYGEHIKITKIGLYENGKYIRWVKLNEKLLEVLLSSEFKID